MCCNFWVFFVIFGCKISGFKNPASVKEMTNMRYVVMLLFEFDPSHCFRLHDLTTIHNLQITFHICFENMIFSDLCCVFKPEIYFYNLFFLSAFQSSSSSSVPGNIFPITYLISQYLSMPNIFLKLIFSCPEESLWTAQ